jgi:hypothetical protein
MINEIKLFLFILSFIFTLRFIFQFTYHLTSDTPEPIKLKEIEKMLLYFASAYIITYILI